MKKFKIEYGIVREYDEVTCGLSRLMMIWMRWFCGIAVGEILSVFTERGKKGREGSDQKG